MIGRTRIAAAAACALAACSDTTTSSVVTLNLERPVDVAFACYGGLRLTNGGPADGTQEVIESAQPAESCAIRSLPTDETPPGQEVLGVGNDPSAVYGFAFIVQSVPGTVGIAQFPSKPSASFQAGDVTVIDSDSLTPGKNGITVGSLPVAIATDTLGCHVVTANAGSCDLSVLSVNSVLQHTPAPEINRVAVVDGAGAPVLAKPAAMFAEPPTGTVGVTCPAAPAGLFYVAYPSCHAVALVDAGGHIQQSVRFAADGTASIGGADLSCPTECGDMRDPPTPGPRPVTLDFMVDPRSGRKRMAIGAENSKVLTVVDLDATNHFDTFEQVALSGDVGVLDVSLSPEIGMGGQFGIRNDDTATGGQFQFIYAVATDGTVRVADVLNQNRECDTQIDPRYIHDVNNVGDLSCLEIGAPGRPRRATARGPGLQIPGDGVPLSVRIFGVDLAEENLDASPLRLVGYFAAIGVSTGKVFYANVDDDYYPDTEDLDSPLRVALPLAIAHQLRDSVPTRDLRAQQTDSQSGEQERICDTNGPAFDNPDANAGGPRLSDDPVRFLNTAFTAATKGYTLPGLRQLRCEGADKTMAVSELGFAADEAVREAAYPDLGAMPATEQWTMVWEGSLSRDTDTSDVDGPAVRIGEFHVGGNGMRVEDASHPFCAVGVEPHDVVAMRGCDPSTGDSQCPAGYTCFVHPDAQVSAGSCLPFDQVDALSGPCRDFLISTRRYSVASAKSGELKLVERPRVLRTSPLDGCTSASQCQDLYVAEARLASDEDPGADTTVPAARSFACEPDPSRNDPTRDRCVMTCDPAGDSSDCDAGTVCNAAGRCVEGVVPPLQCVEALQRFEVRASDAYTVIGTISGYQHSIVEAADGTCVKDPSTPLLVGRIPLAAPACSGDGLTDILPNPCQVTLDHTYVKPLYAADSCDAADPSEALVTEPATAIRFRNPQLTFHLVNPTYPGDLRCKGDRLGGLVGVPTVFPGQTIQMTAVDGLVPVDAGVGGTFPIRIVGGPQNSLWVVDEGDFQSSSTSSRGKVFRIEPVDLGTINTLQ